MSELSYRRHRFPPVVIQHAVWLYLRFTLSYRDVEELLAERGLNISYETVRSWVLKFGPVIARPAAASPSSPEQPMAPGRDGGPDCRQAHVSVACRRPRRRGPRDPGPASSRPDCGRQAHAQAAPQPGLRADESDDRQAALLRR